MIKYVPAVYIKAETRRKEKSMKNIATNFHEHLMEERKWGGVKDIFEKGANISQVTIISYFSPGANVRL